MKDEVNAHGMILNSAMDAMGVDHGNTDISEGETERDEFEEESNGTLESYESNEGSDRKRAENMPTSKLTQQRENAINHFEFYITLRNILSLIALFAVAVTQFVFYRYYYLSGILVSFTFLLYILLFIPLVYENLSESYWCSFGVVVIRIFHMVSILTIFSGVETCLYHYNKKVQDTINDDYINTLKILLYILIGFSILFTYTQNIYVIKYDNFMVYRWKLFYCCRGQYSINEDGSWRGDLNPITGCDGWITLLLFITTFACIIITVISINKMEFIIDSIPQE